MSIQHPGTIRFENTLTGEVEDKPASEVPDAIAFIELEDGPVPVVRVVLSGEGLTRRISSYGAGGELLQTTVGLVES